MMFSDLVLEGQLWTYLADLKDAAACKEYREVLRLITKDEEKLLASMTDEQKKLFSRYTDDI